MFYINNNSPLIKHQHSHDYYELYFFISGHTSYSVEKQVHEFKKGDFIIIPPNIKHHPVLDSSLTPYTGYVIFITPDFLNNLCEMEEKIAYLFQYVSENNQYIFHTPSPTWHGILSAFQTVNNEFRSDKYCHEFAAYIAVINLLINLTRTIYYLTNEDERNNPNEELITAIKNYIDVNYFNEISLDETSQIFFIGSSTLSRLFKEKVGLSFHKYVIQQRLNAAKNDILANKAVSIVYQDNGFKDYSNFYKAFKKEFGVSPTKYYEQTKNS